MELVMATTTARALAAHGGVGCPCLIGGNGSATKTQSPAEEAAARLAKLLIAGRIDPALILAFAGALQQLQWSGHVDVVVTEAFLEDYEKGKVRAPGNNDAVHRPIPKKPHAQAALHVRRRLARGPVRLDELIEDVAAILAGKSARIDLEDLRAAETAVGRLSDLGDIGNCEKEIKNTLRPALDTAIADYRKAALELLVEWEECGHIVSIGDLVHRGGSIKRVHPKRKRVSLLRGGPKPKRLSSAVAAAA